jgi:ribosomal protein L11 methyltransferase
MFDPHPMPHLRSDHPTRFVWRKLSAAKWEDVWPERLSEFADRLAITSLVGAKTIRLEVFELTKAQAERVQRAFGGTVSGQKRDWIRTQRAKRAPIRVRGKLAVVTSAAERAAIQGQQPILIIPAGMAFGTGEHATTATCLRLLADIADELKGQPWDLLDLGCGSGILALAARLLGASKVEAGDFDPACIRIAKENAKTNDLRGARIHKLDVLQWQPDRTWPVITANLFSSLLIQIAPKLAQALARDGRLIFSGILREQEREVVAAFTKAGLRIEHTIRQGKWIAGLAGLKTPRRKS